MSETRDVQSPMDAALEAAAPDEERVAAALADLAAIVDTLRRLELEDVEPAFAFDASWEEAER